MLLGKKIVYYSIKEVKYNFNPQVISKGVGPSGSEIL